MPDLPRSHLLGYALAGLLLVVAARWLHGAPAPAPTAAQGAPATASRGPAGVRVDAPSATIVVDVTGAVRHPGVYRLPSGDRVQEAVARAGGATRHADLDALNLAARVEDGRQVIVPRRRAAGGAAASAAAGAGAAAAPVNLNTATADELATLDGIGPAMAQKILDFRREHGGFGSVDDLDQVPGIGPKRLAALRTKVTA